MPGPSANTLSFPINPSPGWPQLTKTAGAMPDVCVTSIARGVYTAPADGLFSGFIGGTVPRVGAIVPEYMLTSKEFLVVGLSNGQRWFLPVSPFEIAHQQETWMYHGSCVRPGQGGVMHGGFFRDALRPGYHYRGPSIRWRTPNHIEHIVVLSCHPSESLSHDRSYFCGSTITYGLGYCESAVDARLLKIGDALTYSYPLQLVQHPSLGTVLTDGSPYIFPQTRPVGLQWDSESLRPVRFAQSIGAKHWPLFIKALTGCYLDGILPQNAGERDLSTARERMKQIGTNADPERARPLGQCFNPPHNCHRVEVGENLIFTLHRKGSTPIFVVDAPRTCALYVFANEGEAADWALRAMSFCDARTKCLLWIPHTDGWEKRIATWLRNANVEGY